MGEEMRAIIFERYGPPEVLKLSRVPVPAVGANEVQVRVKAASINPADCKTRSGMFKVMSGWKFPKPLGNDLAGEVTQVGPGVTGYKPGDAVYGFRGMGFDRGTYADYVNVSPEVIAPKPKNLSFVEAAAVPLAAVTALQALRDKGGLKAGAEVLVIGASGGVGTFAVQIVKALGARVTGVCSTRNVELVKGLGADRVIDYTKEDFTKDAARYELVCDTVDGKYAKSLPVLKPGGTFVTIAPGAAVMLRAPLSFLTSRKVKPVFAGPKTADIRQLTEWIEAGKVKPVIDRVFPLSQVVEAHKISESGRARGKLVLDLEAAD